MKTDPVIAELTRKLGRPLRVLHIGNIANNAYNNAVIQRQYGIEAEVLSYNYYHIMSCPEWEDARFRGHVDPNYPDWWSTNLKGWRRPDWFVQGPLAECLQYLRMRRLGLPRLQRLLWIFLEARCLGVARYRAEVESRPSTRRRLRHMLAIALVKGLGIAKAPDWSEAFKQRLRDISPAPLAGKAMPDRVPAPEPSSLQDTMSVENGDPGYTIGETALALGKKKLPDAGPGLARSKLIKILNKIHEIQEYVFQTLSKPHLAREKMINLANYILFLFFPPLKKELETFKSTFSGLSEINYNNFTKRYNLFMHHANDIPDIEKTILEEYLLDNATQFHNILEYYDIVQGYSIDGYIPLMRGFSSFTSYEHGTLRDLPFGNDFYGVVTRVVYKHSPRVFVTNSDVLPSVERLGLDPTNVVCLPHAFDDEKLGRFLRDRPELRPDVGPPVFFSPTRHHWIDTSGSWTKGNDVLLRAAGIVAAEGLDFRLELVEWGNDVAASRALIDELGIADKVIWVPAMQKYELWTAYCKASAVVDQFILPALGGVGFESMALGRRLITAIDSGQLTRFFGEAPPCLAASTVDDCAQQLRAVIADPHDGAGRGKAAAAWMRKYHSAERIVALQAAAYRDCLVQNGTI